MTGRQRRSNIEFLVMEQKSDGLSGQLPPSPATKHNSLLLGLETIA